VIITILAAGRHSRLQDVIGDTPKALYPLTPKGDNLLSFLLNGLKNWDLSDFLLIAGEYFEQFSRFCSARGFKKVKVVKANPDYVNGPIFTFLTALPAFAEKFTLIFPADLFIAPQGYRILTDVIGKGETRLFTQPLQPFHHGPLVLHNKIFAQKDVLFGQDAQALIPIAQVTPEFVAFAQKLSREGTTRIIDAFPAWQERGHPLEFVSVPSFFWIDVDTLPQLIQLQNYMRKSKGK
jgi:NDP-sugar pyrophosphorylase family protein